MLNESFVMYLNDRLMVAALLKYFNRRSLIIKIGLIDIPIVWNVIPLAFEIRRLAS